MLPQMQAHQVPSLVAPVMIRSHALGQDQQPEQRVEKLMGVARENRWGDGQQS